MKKILLCLFFPITLVSAQEASSGKNILNRFRDYITGDFDNSRQIIAEMKAGQLIHPLAIHVNRVADEKVINKPPNLNGFFILEESYYLANGKIVESKPYLFLFTLKAGGIIHLTTFQLTQYKKEELRNDNAALQFDYLTLVPSPTFQGADYSWDAKKKTFSTISVNDLGNGMRFTLSETFTSQSLQVMELLEKNGQRLTPYDTPILYDRK